MVRLSFGRYVTQGRILGEGLMLKRLALSVAVIAFCSNCTPDNEDSNNAATTNGGTTDTAGTSTQASAGTIARTGGNAGIAGTPNRPMPTAGTVGSSAGTPGDTGGLADNLLGAAPHPTDNLR